MTIAASSVVGGVIPLAPYLICHEIRFVEFLLAPLRRTQRVDGVLGQDFVVPISQMFQQSEDEERFDAGFVGQVCGSAKEVAWTAVLLGWRFC
jgi:hypothetical protein